MIKVNVSLEKEGPLSRWLVTAPVGFAEALRKATRLATPLMAGAIRTATPIRTGRLLGSISDDVQDTPTGAMGRIVTHIRYARYVEFGTREHGGPQRYFLKGSSSTMPAAKAIFDYEVRRVAESFGN